MKHTTDIVIPTFNNEAYTVKCLESVRKHTDNYRIVWVDNGSTAESREIVLTELKQHKKYLSVWLSSNTGFVTATNIGISQGISEYVVLLNNDTEVIPNWLERLKEPFDADPNAYIVGPLTSDCASWQAWPNVKKNMYTDIPEIKYLTTDEIANTLYKMYKGKFRVVSMVAFFCTMIKREAFTKVGLLSTQFGIGLGDDDYFCHHVKNTLKGNIIFYPATFCYHHHRTTFKTLFSKKELQKIQNENIALYHKLIR